MLPVLVSNMVQMDADLVFDVRFLPNPYYVENYARSGLDDLVYNYVMKWKETEIFFDKLTDLLKVYDSRL